MKRPSIVPTLLAPLLLSACASIPEGPTVLVLKGGTKTFQQFARDDTVCRRFAALEARGTPPDQAFIAATSPAPPASPPALAATPLSAGVRPQQQLYDIAYAQCMDDKGHRVPGAMPEELPAAPLLPETPLPSPEANTN
ncbi:hypothetical protein ACW73L_09825 [Methylolobus aquaticus]